MRKTMLVLVLALSPGLSACSSDDTKAEDSNASRCVVNADCEKADNPCVVGTCAPSGQCDYQPTADGEAAKQEKGDCARVLCKKGTVVREQDTGDVEDDHEPCTLDACEGLQALHKPVIDGTSCKIGSGTGTCRVGQCLVLCTAENTARQCDDTNACTDDSCQPCEQDYCRGQGLCQHTKLDGPGADDKNDCTQDSCKGGVEEHQPMPAASPCTTSGGRVCDALGKCLPCLVDEDCPDVGVVCHRAVCKDAACEMELAPEGTDAGPEYDPVGDCRRMVCDESGGLDMELDDTDVPEGDPPCSVGKCNEGSASYSYAPADTSCGDEGRICNGSGECCGEFRYAGAVTDVIALRHAYAGSSSAQRYLAKFHLADGTTEDIVSVPNVRSGVGAVAFAAETGRVFYLENQEFGLLMDCGDTSFDGRELTPPDTLPEISWPSALTYDPTGKRVLLATQGGEGVLYSYRVTDGAWTVLTNLGNIDITSAAYASGAEKLFLVDANWRARIYRHSAAGALETTVNLDPPVEPPTGITSPSLQMAAADGLVYYILYASLNGETWYSLIRIDPSTGGTEVVYSSH